MKSLVILIFILPAVCFAYKPDRAIANLADDYTTCTAYFIAMSEGRKTVKNDEYVKNLKEFARYSLSLAIKLSV